MSVIEREREREREIVVKMVDALPQRTIGAMANMALKVPQARVQAFIGQVREGCEGGWRGYLGWEVGWVFR